MSFHDIKVAKKNANLPIKEIIGDGGTHNYKCPACEYEQFFYGYWPTRCNECGQEVAVCNIYGQCSYRNFD